MRLDEVRRRLVAGKLRPAGEPRVIQIATLKGYDPKPGDVYGGHDMWSDRDIYFVLSEIEYAAPSIGGSVWQATATPLVDEAGRDVPVSVPVNDVEQHDSERGNG